LLNGKKMIDYVITERMVDKTFECLINCWNEFKV
jgi:hypothetical protein